MKLRIFFLTLALLLCSLAAQELAAQNTVWPQGKAAFSTASGTGLTRTATITNRFTYLTVNMDTTTTLHLDVLTKMPEGSLLFIEANSDATARTLVAGDKLQFPNITGVISKGKVLALVWKPSLQKFVIFSERQYN
jgi:hypothetical protein